MFKANANDTSVKDAQGALTQFWGSAGDLGMAEAAAACRKLQKKQLEWLHAWIPSGQGRTKGKCDKARSIVAGVIGEK
jgi:hypothetical protein